MTKVIFQKTLLLERKIIENNDLEDCMVTWKYSKFNHVSDASTYAQVADTTHNNTTTAADVATLTIPAGRLNAGSLICVKSAGYVLDNNSSDTLTPVLKIGSTTLLTGAALDVADNDVLMLEANNGSDVKFLGSVLETLN